MIADPRIPRPGRVRARHVPAELVNAGMLPRDAERVVLAVALDGGIARLLAGGRW